MSKKREVQQAWLEAAMKLYYSMGTEERAQLFMRTCANASVKFTARELERMIPKMESWTLDREDDE